MELIAKLIDDKLRNDYIPRKQGRISASQWHPCDRNLWLKRRDAVNDKPYGYAIRHKMIERQIKPMLIDLLQSVGAKVAMCGAELGSGNIDGVVRMQDGAVMLLSLHVVTNLKFNAIKKHGMTKVCEKHHYSVQLYMHQSVTLSKSGKPLEKCLFVVMNNGTNELYFEIVDRNEWYAEEFLIRIDNADNDEIPEKNVADHTCNMCEYQELCNKNALPALSCGTCAHWSTENKCDFGDSVCDRHVFSPLIMALCGYDYHDVNYDFGSIEYSDFINGPASSKSHNKTDKPIYTSAEMIALAETPDDNIAEFIKRFGAEYKPCN